MWLASIETLLDNSDLPESDERHLVPTAELDRGRSHTCKESLGSLLVSNGEDSVLKMGVQRQLQSTQTNQVEDANSFIRVSYRLGEFDK